MAAYDSDSAHQKQEVARESPQGAQENSDVKDKFSSNDSESAETETWVAVWSVMLQQYEASLPYNCTSAYREAPLFGLRVVCFYITDDPVSEDLVALGWVPHIIKVPDSQIAVPLQRRLKVMGSELDLQGFDFSIYHDANVGPCAQDDQSHAALEVARSIFVASWIMKEDPELQLLGYLHPTRHSVAEERQAVARLDLCSQDKLLRNVKLLQDYVDNRDLPETNVLIRRGSSDATMKLGGQLWYDAMTSTGCFRDQVAFSYAMWKANVSYRLLPLKEKRWCKNFGHLDKYAVRSFAGTSSTRTLGVPQGQLSNNASSEALQTGPAMVADANASGAAEKQTSRRERADAEEQWSWRSAFSSWSRFSRGWAHTLHIL